MITEHEQEVPEKSSQVNARRLAAIAVVLAIYGASGLAAAAEYLESQPPAIATWDVPPSRQTDSRITLLPPVTDGGAVYRDSQARYPPPSPGGFGETHVNTVAAEYLEAQPPPNVTPDVPPSRQTDSRTPLLPPVTDGGTAYRDSRAWYRRLSLGGYGEMHVNTDQAPDNDVFDLHRMVLFLGYEFTDWLVFSSELELEHAFGSKDSGGELGFEQAYVEYVHSDCLRVRAGRVLVPLGIINQKHEPPTFNGVERPSFARYIIPTTWSADGIGIEGWLRPGLKYEAYWVTSLDGSQFNAKDGIRGGRIKERPSVNEMAFTGRLDFFPFAIRRVPGAQTLRAGVSTFIGGLDNGNKGDNPGIDAEIAIISADLEYSVSCFDLRGVFAYEDITGAAQIGNGTASQILGWYVEGAVHVWPERWRYGRMRRADAVIFVRFDDFDTQHGMPAGVARNDAGDRDEWTFGITFLPVPNFALKFDYQVRDDATTNHLADLVNLGVGWQF